MKNQALCAVNRASSVTRGALVAASIIVVTSACTPSEVGGDSGDATETGPAEGNEGLADVPPGDGDGGGEYCGTVPCPGPECTEVDNCNEPDFNICDLRCFSTEGRCVFVGRDPVCPAEVDPECGCDGVTYRNDCERLLARQRLKHDGPCGEVACPPVCARNERYEPDNLMWLDSCTGEGYCLTDPLDRFPISLRHVDPPSFIKHCGGSHFVGHFCRSGVLRGA